MIVALRGRGDFQRLRTEGRRHRSGAVWCTYRAESEGAPPRVAFAVGRTVGTAVRRNTVRRRIRAILRSTALAPGDYLFGASPAAVELPFDQLRASVMAVLERHGAARR